MSSDASLSDLPLDPKHEIIDHIRLQDAAYIKRSLNKLVVLEDLTMGIAEDLDERFGKKKWNFSGTLRSLRLTVPTLTRTIVNFISPFSALSYLHLYFVKPLSNEDLPEISLPNLSHLSLSFPFPTKFASDFESTPNDVISRFASLPRLEKLALRFRHPFEDFPNERRAPLSLPRFRKLLLPFSGASQFPSLRVIVVTETTCGLLSPTVLYSSSRDLLPSRPHLEFKFLTPLRRKDSLKSYEQVKDTLRFLKSAASESDVRSKALCEVEDTLRWGLEKVEKMGDQSQDRDGIGATREVRELLENLKVIYALRQLEAD